MLRWWVGATPSGFISPNFDHFATHHTLDSCHESSCHHQQQRQNKHMSLLWPIHVVFTFCKYKLIKKNKSHKSSSVPQTACPLGKVRCNLWIQRYVESRMVNSPDLKTAPSDTMELCTPLWATSTLWASKYFLESQGAITPPRGPPSISCKVRMMWPHPVDLHVFPGKPGGCYSTRWPPSTSWKLGAVFPPCGPLGPSWIPYTSRFFLESRGAVPFHGFVGNPPGRRSADNSLAASVAGKEGFFWVMKIR